MGENMKWLITFADVIFSIVAVIYFISTILDWMISKKNKSSEQMKKISLVLLWMITVICLSFYNGLLTATSFMGFIYCITFNFILPFVKKNNSFDLAHTVNKIKADIKNLH